MPINNYACVVDSTGTVAQKGDGSTALITHTGATVGVNGADQTTNVGSGALVFINITAITAGSLTVTLQGLARASGVYYTIIASAALTTTGLTVLRVYPGLTAAANLTVSDVLPVAWRVISAIATGPVTATVAVTTCV